MFEKQIKKIKERVGLIPHTYLYAKNGQVDYYNWWECDPNKEWFNRFIENNNILDDKKIHFYSMFGKKAYIKRHASNSNVFFSGENLFRDEFSSYRDYCMAYTGLSMGFDYVDNDKYLRFPLWILYCFEPYLDIKRIRERIAEINNSRNKGLYKCVVISNHDKWNTRTPICDALENILEPLYAATWRNNTRLLWDEYDNNKIQLLKNCKFTICPENTNAKGYVTEKLFEAMWSGAIPIYFGSDNNPEPEVVNKEAVILWDIKNPDNNKDNISLINKMLSDVKYYDKFVQQRKILKGADEYIYEKMYILKEKFISL